MQIKLLFENGFATVDPAYPGSRLLRYGLVSLCVLALTLAGLAWPLSAQDSPADAEDPGVERITFRGVRGVSERILRASIATQETRCRALLLKPFCLVSDAPLVVEHERLDRQELERDVVRLRVAYFRRGYREASVAVEIRPLDEGVEVVFHVQEGEVTSIEEMEVRQSEEVLSRREIRRARLPREGDPLNLVGLDLGISYLKERLGSAGYLDNDVRDSASVDLSSRRARVTVTIDTGRRSTLDELDIRGNARVSDGTIAQALRLRRGRVLRLNDVVAARRSLYESNLFHEVDVTVPAQPDSAKRVEVAVREAPPRAFRVGGGFNTIEFVQVEARYTHNNWLGAGRRLDVRGTLGNLLAPQLNDRLIFRDVLPAESVRDEDPFLKPTWQLSIGFLQPAFQSAENVLGTTLFANRRTVPGIVVDRGYGADVSLTRRIDYDTPISLSYAYELTSIEAGELYFCVNYGVCEMETVDALRGSNAMSPISVGLLAERADHPLAPTSGHRARVDVEHASGFTGSDFRYNRIAAEGSYYFPLDVYRRRVLAGRARIGWVRHMAGTAEAVGIDVDGEAALLHPRKRFYAGGSRSVRGYAENQLGPRTLTIDPRILMEAENGCSAREVADGSCDPSGVAMDAFLPRPVGGTAVLEASVEYRFPFMGGVNGALFVDGGMVGEGIRGTFSGESWAVTPGFGVRFSSPVGPVRLDLGVRPAVTDRLPVVTEFVDENGERRLVELETRRRYNPVEAAGGGFLNEVFSRLALHLSIGEAY